MTNIKEPAPVRVGVVGCGSISVAYMRNAPLFRGVEICACADIVGAAAEARANEYGLEAVSVDALMASDDIDLVLNLTVPQAHYDVSMRALRAGKHVFTEKPLAATAAEGRRLVNAASAAGLAIGSAPDTFLGPAGREARRLIDAGAIGTPTLGTAFMMGRGMEHWHPDPAFYFQPGGGPMLDMGPYYLTMLTSLLGPVSRVQSLAATGEAERLITAPGPKNGTCFSVGTPTTLLTLLTFASGTIVTFGTSWDVFRHTNEPIELHGDRGSLRLPDPDNFGGTIGLSERGGPWREIDTKDRPLGADNWPIEGPDRANYRMVGLCDMAMALREGRRPRASGERALHVLEVMEAALRAAETGEAQETDSAFAPPEALTEEEVLAMLA